MIFKEPFASLPVDINKYTRGTLVLVVGSNAYTGAAALSACAAERIGAGYTEVVTTPEARDVVRQASLSLVVRDRDRWDIGSLEPATSTHPFAIGLGSGFEGTVQERDLTAEILAKAQCSVLVDGSAFDFMGKKKMRKLLKRRKKNGYATIFTPHDGEAARLAKAAQIKLDKADRSSNARMLAQAYQAIVVLKGPCTYISDGDITTAMTLGTPALAKAGTGDVLAGIISGLLAQGVDPYKAALTGALVHALAGREAEQRFTETAVVASDLISFLPLVIAQMGSSNASDGMPGLVVEISDEDATSGSGEESQIGVDPNNNQTGLTGALFLDGADEEAKEE